MKHKLVVLMLGHKSLRGKDVVAKALRPLGWGRLAFADKLKATVADLYDFSYEQMHGNLKDVEDKRYPNEIDPVTIEHPFIPGHDVYILPVKNPIYKPYLTPRRVLQIFGQDQRKLFPDIWAQYIFTKISNSVGEPTLYPYSLFVITDFRFQNEYTVAKRWAETPDEVFEKIIIPVKINRDIVATAGNDLSENDLNDFKEWFTEIDNDGTLEDLAENAECLHTIIESKYGLK